MRIERLVLAWLLALASWVSAQPIVQPTDLAAAYAREVDRRWLLPPPEQAYYALQLSRALAEAGVAVTRDQLVVLVDRSAQVQAAMLWWLPVGGAAMLIGASPASTGRPSGFEHFETPTGVFDHTLDNADFRAEGTRNEFGIRGYGDKGLRVYDFGWVIGKRAWAPGEQAMRLQLHATDRDKLEPRLGERASKGCIRIPATMNRFLDHHAMLDAAYEAALAQGHKFWVLRPDREPTPLKAQPPPGTLGSTSTSSSSPTIVEVSRFGSGAPTCGCADGVCGVISISIGWAGLGESGVRIGGCIERAQASAGVAP